MNIGATNVQIPTFLDGLSIIKGETLWYTALLRYSVVVTLLPVTQMPGVRQKLDKWSHICNHHRIRTAKNKRPIEMMEDTRESAPDVVDDNYGVDYGFIFPHSFSDIEVPTTLATHIPVESKWICSMMWMIMALLTHGKTVIENKGTLPVAHYQSRVFKY